jgi:TetR/AcrR family transcriptional regulator
MSSRALAAVAEIGAPIASDEPRAQLIDATLTVVAARGHAGVGVAEILATAGLSRESFDREFASREECLLASYDLAAGWVEDWVGADLAGRGLAWAPALRRAVASTAELLEADPRLARIGAEMPFAGPAGLERQRLLVARLSPLLAIGRREREESGELPADLERTLLGGALFSFLRAPRPTELVVEIAYFLLAPYLGPAAARRLAERG